MKSQTPFLAREGHLSEYATQTLTRIFLQDMQR